jgi:GPH family glycoside/pentoside/hexuronide:cation symporter
MPERMSGARRILYALGSTGFQLTERIVVNISIYFYLPPAGRGLEPQVSEAIFLGGLTAFGLAMIIGRIFDSLTDLVVGHASDRSRSRLGRRRVFLILGIVPMVGLPVLLFWPPGAAGSTLNAGWLTLLVGFYFVAFTIYVAPYLALIPEIASGQSDRVRLASLLGAMSFPVLGLFAAAWPIGIDWGRAAGWEPAAAMRAIVLVTSAVALVLCALPILAVDERRFARSLPSDLSFGAAVRQTLGNRPFLLYLGAQLLFILGVNMIQPALVYYATVVLGRSEGFSATLGLVLFVTTLLALGVMNPLARRLGPKRAMILCIVVFGFALMALGGLRPDAPGGPHDARNLTLVIGVMALSGFPVAGFLVLPYVLISQLIDWDEKVTGANRAAMYFGLQGFFTKWMYGVSGAVLAFLFARFGNSPDQALGVVLVGPIAGVACLLSAFLYALYPERRILAETLRHELDAAPALSRPLPEPSLD